MREKRKYVHCVTEADCLEQDGSGPLTNDSISQIESWSLTCSNVTPAIKFVSDRDSYPLIVFVARTELVFVSSFGRHIEGLNNLEHGLGEVFAFDTFNEVSKEASPNYIGGFPAYRDQTIENWVNLTRSSFGLLKGVSLGSPSGPKFIERGLTANDVDEFTLLCEKSSTLRCLVPERISLHTKEWPPFFAIQNQKFFDSSIFKNASSQYNLGLSATSLHCEVEIG